MSWLVTPVWSLALSRQAITSLTRVLDAQMFSLLITRAGAEVEHYLDAWVVPVISALTITCRIFKKDLQLPDVKPKDHEWNH
ncbi:unnamed protein product [Prunus armeniaca]|uniref:Uncharacterized protein n=1 Tax=Prunus armeniaca TaxID=36596 RepID=A0A6J5WB83_PRUAR|nr:unnamed protein product [Prunus armeniaca]